MIKGICAALSVLVTLGLYCCLVQGKKEDELIDKIYRDEQEKEDGKDE